jgi:hypothetical protein
VGKQNRVRPRNVEVVGLGGDLREEAFYVGASRSAAAPVGEFDADEQLGRADRGDRDVVLILDQLAEPRLAALSLDEDRRIEDQSRQRRSSGVRPARSSRNSRGQARSRGRP